MVLDIVAMLRTIRSLGPGMGSVGLSSLVIGTGYYIPNESRRDFHFAPARIGPKAGRGKSP